jgi:hypothetical protein
VQAFHQSLHAGTGEEVLRRVRDGASLQTKMLVRELTLEESSDPRKKRRLDFWNVTHAMEHGSDVRLGIWKTKPPKLPPFAFPSSASLVVFGWPARGRFGMATLPLGLLERNLDLLGTGTPDDVVVARRSLPDTMFTELEKRFSYRPSLVNQEDGWWFLDNKVIPHRAPARHEGLAVLPELRDVGATRAKMDALLLVEIDDFWRVLSERALRVYNVGAAVDDQQPVQFVQWKNRRRVVWDVHLAASISQDVVRDRFGDEAADRALQHAQSIVVRCVRRQ